MMPLRHVITSAPEGELQVITYPVHTPGWVDSVGVMTCHGAGGTAMGLMDVAGFRQWLNATGQFCPSLAGDFGFNTWGNDTFVSRAENAREYLASNYGVTKPLIIVAGSMGFINAVNYAKRYPQHVAAIAGSIPGCDLTDIWANRGGGASVDLAYGGAYDPDVHGPERNPVEIVDDLDPDMPIHLWSSSNDPTTVPATVQAFLDARPQTAHDSVGALGHTSAAMVASLPGLVAELKRWTK